MRSKLSFLGIPLKWTGFEPDENAAVDAGEGCAESHTVKLARQLEQLTGLEARVTILGHVQRGGAPSPADRLLATRLGTACAELINEGHYGVMVASRGDGTLPIPLEQVAGHRKTVPLDHAWVKSARLVGTNLGD